MARRLRSATILSIQQFVLSNSLPEAAQMNLSELFLEKIGELKEAEQQVVKALPALVEATTNAELQAAFQHHLKQTEQQASRIDYCFHSLRLADKSFDCKPMQALIADGVKASKIEPENVMRDIAMLGAAQRSASSISRLLRTFPSFLWPKR